MFLLTTLCNIRGLTLQLHKCPQRVYTFIAYAQRTTFQQLKINILQKFTHHFYASVAVVNKVHNVTQTNGVNEF